MEKEGPRCGIWVLKGGKVDGMRLASCLGLSLAVRDGFPLRDGYRCQYNEYEKCLSCQTNEPRGGRAPPMGIMGMVQS